LTGLAFFILSLPTYIGSAEGQQIPPLRYGMTTREQTTTKATAAADLFADDNKKDKAGTTTKTAKADAS
jgi:hypothetical protein